MDQDEEGVLSYEQYGRMSSSATGEPKAVPFISVQAGSEELEVGTEAMEILDSMHTRKIAVIVLCGTQGTGKSFLANRFLDRMQGFKTRGLLG